VVPRHALARALGIPRAAVFPDLEGHQDPLQAGCFGGGLGGDPAGVDDGDLQCDLRQVGKAPHRWHSLPGVLLCGAFTLAAFLWVAQPGRQQPGGKQELADQGILPQVDHPLFGRGSRPGGFWYLLHRPDWIDVVLWHRPDLGDPHPTILDSLCDVNSPGGRIMVISIERPISGCRACHPLYHSGLDVCFTSGLFCLFNSDWFLAHNLRSQSHGRGNPGFSLGASGRRATRYTLPSFICCGHCVAGDWVDVFSKDGRKLCGCGLDERYCGPGAEFKQAVPHR
jgi:hypothetical protein